MDGMPTARAEPQGLGHGTQVTGEGASGSRSCTAGMVSDCLDRPLVLTQAFSTCPGEASVASRRLFLVGSCEWESVTLCSGGPPPFLYLWDKAWESESHWDRWQVTG